MTDGFRYGIATMSCNLCVTCTVPKVRNLRLRLELTLEDIEPNDAHVCLCAPGDVDMAVILYGDDTARSVDKCTLTGHSDGLPWFNEKTKC